MKVQQKQYLRKEKVVLLKRMISEESCFPEIQKLCQPPDKLVY